MNGPSRWALDEQNRWVKLSQCIPWDELAEGYYRSFSADQGRPAKDARLVIGAAIIKHELCLSGEEAVQQIQENPYLQPFARDLMLRYMNRHVADNRVIGQKPRYTFLLTTDARRWV